MVASLPLYDFYTHRCEGYSLYSCERDIDPSGLTAMNSRSVPNFVEPTVFILASCQHC